MVQKSGGNQGSYVSIHPNFILFSRGACNDYGISPGLQVGFVLEADRIYCYFDSDGDGFACTKNKEAVRVYCSSVIKKLFNQYPNLTRNSSRMPLRDTRTRVSDRPLIEILFHNKLTKNIRRK